MKTLSAIALGCMFGLCGCITVSSRDAAVAKVVNHGADVSTRHRYHLSCVYGGDNSQNWSARFHIVSVYLNDLAATEYLPFVHRLRLSASP